MSQAQRRHLRLETIDNVTVVSFVESKIVSDESIQEVGEQLYGLVDNDGHRQILLNFGNVQYLSSAALGKLINLKKKVGAVGGKLCGAGGGGFLLLACPPDRQPQVRAALSHLKELPFNLERDGTKVIFNVRR